jgi:hypothetical protein
MISRTNICRTSTTATDRDIVIRPWVYSEHLFAITTAAAATSTVTKNSIKSKTRAAPSTTAPDFDHDAGYTHGHSEYAIGIEDLHHGYAVSQRSLWALGANWALWANWALGADWTTSRDFGGVFAVEQISIQ